VPAIGTLAILAILADRAATKPEFLTNFPMHIGAPKIAARAFGG